MTYLSAPLLPAGSNGMAPILLEPSSQQFFAQPDAHRRLLADKTRLATFERAIRATVRPGDTVLEIGAGTGILSQYAIEAGATTLYLIEENPHILDIARRRLSLWKRHAHLVFLRGRSVEIPLAKIRHKVDVVISETLGTLAFNEGILPTLYDARRFLRSTGICIPQEVRLLGALCNVAGIPPRNASSHSGVIERHATTSVVGAPTLLFRRELPPNILEPLSASVQCTPTIGDANAVAFWMEATLTGGVDLSCSPAGPASSWGHVIMPLGELSSFREVRLDIVADRYTVDQTQMRCSLSGVLLTGQQVPLGVVAQDYVPTQPVQRIAAQTLVTCHEYRAAG